MRKSKTSKMTNTFPKLICFLVLAIQSIVAQDNSEWLDDTTNSTTIIEEEYQHYWEPGQHQITLPDESCEDDQMYDAVQNLLNKLRNFRHNAFSYLAFTYYNSFGIDISSPDGVRRLACYMSDISSVEEIAQLYVGYPNYRFIEQFNVGAPYLQTLGTDTIRQELLCLRKLIQWIEKTGFPHLPLMDTTYADTWQFFTELQNQQPQGFDIDIRLFNNIIFSDPETSPLINILTTSPEVLARLLHDDNNDGTALESLFTDRHGVSHLEMLRRIPMSVFSDIEHIYTPYAIALLEFVTVIHERGWFEL